MSPSDKEDDMGSADVRAFQPNDYLVQLEDGPYLPVQWRLVWFHQATSPRAGYVTVEQRHDRRRGFASFVTIAWDGSDTAWRTVRVAGVEIAVCGRVATGEGSEERSQFAEYYEAAATKALGRALVGLGFGSEGAPELKAQLATAS
jgi:hypothetical protein